MLNYGFICALCVMNKQAQERERERRESESSDSLLLTPEAFRATEAVEFIAEHLRNEDEYIQVSPSVKIHFIFLRNLISLHSIFLIQNFSERKKNQPLSMRFQYIQQKITILTLSIRSFQFSRHAMFFRCIITFLRNHR